MSRSATIVFAGCFLLALFSDISGRAQPQQPSGPAVSESGATLFAKARNQCKALFSDHAFDALRAKIPLGEDKPTFSMLTNVEKLRAKDKPLADLTIRTLEKCRAAYAPVYALLPAQANALIKGVVRQQDALIAQLYAGKITFGEFNVSMNHLTGELSEALNGIPAGAKPTARAAESVAPPITISHEVRLALIIGNSNYLNLPKLSNPTNDARSVAEVFQKMGYSTQLLLDASEDAIRKQIRKFAGESSKADVAVVYYAGHGAQLNGSNYILPIDIDIPRTEADIQFTGLKVDDLVNSVVSNTKIVFLDACRDNPVLFKNIVKGRGSSPMGLAPAVASNYSQSKPGGGIFIAYATDAGAVADDGKAAHSPFKEALLRYMQKPISIDDMFSFVTREVRLVTKNAQRPYKYASLENIVCLMPACSSSLSTPVGGDIVQQARQSQDEELQIALQTNNSDALESYLQKYPDTSRRSVIQDAIDNIRRSEFTEWTLYEIGDLHLPQYMQLSTIRRFDGRAAVKTKYLHNSSTPLKRVDGKPILDAAYSEDLNVYDCTKPNMAVAETSFFDQSGKLLYHYKWADPQYLNLAIGTTIATGSIGSTARTIACDERVGIPLISKKQAAEPKFRSLSSTNDGDGEILYALDPNSPGTQNEKRVLFVMRFSSDHNIKEFLPQNVSIPDPPNFRMEVDHTLLKCDESRYGFDKVEHWNASNELVRLQVIDPRNIKFLEILKFSPAATLQEIVCGKGYAGLGVRLGSNNGSISVAEVFASSPAEKGGVKVSDVLTHIDHEPLSGMTLEQVIEKVRGPANTRVVLTLLRKDEDKPFDLAITREVIQPQTTQEGGPK